MTFTSRTPSSRRLYERENQHTNEKGKRLHTCCVEQIRAPLVSLYLVQCQSLLGVRHENLSDEAERERVQFAPRRDERVFVVSPQQVLSASDGRLVPRQFFNGKRQKTLLKQ